MKDYIDLIVSILTLLTLASGLYFAIRRFGLKRERFTFLRLAVTASTIYQTTRVALVTITVQLDNKGDTRINARRAHGEDGYLYNDGPDICLHAGTLKIRAIPDETNPLLFDWYTLSPLRLSTRLTPVEDIVISDINLEQINYLDEYQDPTVEYNEVDFWIEPHESYTLTVPIWLTAGVYAAKAFFLGSERKHGEEEYWSGLTIFKVEEENVRQVSGMKKLSSNR